LEVPAISMGPIATLIDPEVPEASVTTTVTVPGAIGVIRPVVGLSTAILPPVSTPEVKSVTTTPAVAVLKVVADPPAARSNDRVVPVTVTWGPNMVWVTDKAN
jgi:hypothetical protein